MGLFSGPDVEGMEAAGDLRRATSFLGTSYDRGPGEYVESVFGTGRCQAMLRELEVWTAAAPPKKGKGAEKPFSMTERMRRI